MSTCLGLLGGELDETVLPNWFTAEHFRHCLLHVEKLENLDPQNGRLVADPFLIPPAIEPSSISGVVVFNCESGEVSTRYAYQVPVVGIRMVEDHNWLCPNICEIIPKPQDEVYKLDCDALLDDPCRLARELRCCLLKLTKEQQQVSVTHKARSASFSPVSEADKLRLEKMILEAEAECAACSGEESIWRGGSLGHSCAGSRRRGGYC